MNGHEAVCWATAFAIVVVVIWVVVWSIIIYRNNIKQSRAADERFALWLIEQRKAQLEKDNLKKQSE